ncbi:40S ribosomal protein S8 {ECO:0000256/RuleBase:RU000669}, partial [Serendipita indica DSM 11827]
MHGDQSVTCKTRIISVNYNASNNELVRTNTLVKGAVIQVDATPFRQWYESHYGQPVSTKKGCAAAAPRRQRRKATVGIDKEKFGAGRLYAVISSRPGQVGRADGYILEGKEL